MSFDVNAVKKAFFDRKAVQAAIDKGLKQALSKFGAFVRKRSRSSIKKAPMIDPKTGLRVRGKSNLVLAQAISQPGQPPYSHTGDLKKLIYFSYDAATKSVVIGPVLKMGGSEAPKLLEHGGTGRKGRYVARPFMRPAFDAELPSAPKKFSALIR